MAGKKKTTFAKLARERKLQERRLEKQAKKDARKQAGNAQPTEPHSEHGATGDDEAPGSFDAADAVA